MKEHSSGMMRSYLYSAIVHGATGLAYFRFHTTWVSDGSSRAFEPWYRDRPGFGALGPEVSPELKAEVTKVNRELDAALRRDAIRLWQTSLHLSLTPSSQVCASYDANLRRDAPAGRLPGGASLPHQNRHHIPLKRKDATCRVFSTQISVSSVVQQYITEA